MCQVTNNNSFLKGSQHRTFNTRTQKIEQKIVLTNLWTWCMTVTEFWNCQLIWSRFYTYDRKVFYSWKMQQAPEAVRIQLSDLAADYPPDNTQWSYRVPSNEKCFVSPDLAKTLEYENPTLLPSRHALPREKSYPDFKQQYLVYLKAPPDKTKGQNPWRDQTVSREAGVLCSDILKAPLGQADCSWLIHKKMLATGYCILALVRHVP